MQIIEGIQLIIVIIFSLETRWNRLCFSFLDHSLEFIIFLSAGQMKGGTEADGRKSPLAVCDDPV